MGLQYTEAETHDLARFVARFAEATRAEFFKGHEDGLAERQKAHDDEDSDARLAAAFRYLQNVTPDDREPMSAAEWVEIALRETAP